LGGARYQTLGELGDDLVDVDGVDVRALHDSFGHVHGQLAGAYLGLEGGVVGGQAGDLAEGVELVGHRRDGAPQGGEGQGVGGVGVDDAAHGGEALVDGQVHLGARGGEPAGAVDDPPL